MAQHDGTADSVDRLFRMYGPKLEHFVAQIIHDSEAARQLVQDIFLSLHQRLLDPSARPLEYPQAFLFKVAHNRACDYLRRRSSSPLQFGIDEERTSRVPDPAAGPEESALLRETLQSISDVLDELPENQRRVFVLGQIENIPRPEISSRLSLTPKAVDHLMTRALKTLRKRLRERGVDLNALGTGDGERGPQ
jgi:RNA polymerase sigma factor (sigma-70 family)